MHAESAGNAVVCNYTCGSRMSNSERINCQSLICDLGIPSVIIYETDFICFLKQLTKLLLDCAFASLCLCENSLIEAH